VLIFDEVITGFRLALKGAQGYYGVTPDLATFGKAVGGGMPLSVLAGTAEYMELIAAGKVVHSGTLNGNPLALVAAAATVDVLASNDGAVFGQMWRLGERLRTGMESILRDASYSVVTSGGGPVFQLSLMQSTPNNYRESMAADTAAYSDLGMALLDEGVLVLPDGRWYVSAAHTDSDIDETLAAVRRAVAGYE
jgi:glutamate-1-semialdehyde 2,1-aminomutase